MSTRLEDAIALQALMAVDVDSEHKRVQEFERDVRLRTSGHCDKNTSIEDRIEIVCRIEKEMFSASYEACLSNSTVTVGPYAPLTYPAYPDPVNYFEISLAKYRRSKTIIALVDRLTSP